MEKSHKRAIFSWLDFMIEILKGFMKNEKITTKGQISGTVLEGFMKSHFGR